MPEFDVAKNVELGISYSVIDDADLDIAAGLSLPLNFNDGADIVSSVGIDMNTRYNLMDGSLAIHTGDELISLGFSGDFTLAINIPVAFAYQANENINVSLGTNLMTISVVGGGGVTSIADTTPLNLDLSYSVDNSTDVMVGLAADAQAFGDSMMFSVGLAYRGL